jgi:transposase
MSVYYYKVEVRADVVEKIQITAIKHGITQRSLATALMLEGLKHSNQIIKRLKHPSAKRQRERARENTPRASSPVRLRNA